jgi:hypothetical protein
VLDYQQYHVLDYQQEIVMAKSYSLADVIMKDSILRSVSGRIVVRFAALVDDYPSLRVVRQVAHSLARGRDS